MGVPLAREDVYSCNRVTKAEAGEKESRTGHRQSRREGEAKHTNGGCRHTDQETAFQPPGHGGTAKKGTAELREDEQTTLRVQERPLLRQNREQWAKHGGAEASQDEAEV